MTAQVWHLEFRAADGTWGSVRFELPPDGPHARYDARLAGPGLGPGVVVVRDDEVPRPRDRTLEVRGEGIWAELVCETPGEHWGFGLEAFGLRFASEEEAATSDVGDRLPVGLDLEWEVTDPGAPTLEGTVRGELLVDARRVAIDAPGTFTSPEL